ncbi:hypothetical protein M0R04_05350 [Candidatus Dojkabacteria bacterium]|jgi:hypothetical protein|nr:hypothetical protein [Candidatus Dojkabacteria bacterium]
MNLIQSIINNRLDEAKHILINLLEIKVKKCLDEVRQYISLSILEEDANIQKLGKVTRIRRRIRRDATGKIVIQRNATRSAMKGYRIVGKSIRRISAVQRLRRSQQLKRSWKSSRRSKLSRSLLKRKMSMRRRHSLGLS